MPGRVATSKTPRLDPGDVVGGRYRIDGVVGRGGFGAVYRATQKDTGVEVALKVLLKNFTNSEVDAKRFKREAALVQKLRHPNVVQLLDFGTTEAGVSYIAFELLKGTPLSKYLKTHGAMPLYRAAQVTRDILSALAAAHAMGIIHRDIKPGNVFLLEGTEVAKVLDFGIAKAVTGEEAAATQLTEAGQMIGTPHYMAPEQVRGTGAFPGTDVYSVGLLFAEMICGCRMVKGSALIDIYMMHISGDPIALPELVTGSPVADVIARAVDKVVEQRFATAGEMLAALDRAMPGLAEGAARPRRTASGQILATAPMSMDEVAEGSGISALSSMPSSRATAAEPNEAEDAAETVMMRRPGMAAEQARLEALLSSHPPGSPDPLQPSGASPLVPNKHLEATLDMDDFAMSPFRAERPSSPPASGSLPAIAPTQAMAPSDAHPGVASGQLHASVSGEHSYALGEQGYASGEHAAGDRASSMPPMGDRSPPKKGGNVALILVLVAIVAMVAAGLLLWAPWEDARAPTPPSRVAVSLPKAGAPRA